MVDKKIKIEILGAGCPKCKQLTINAEADVKEMKPSKLPDASIGVSSSGFIPLSIFGAASCGELNPKRLNIRVELGKVIIINH